MISDKIIKIDKDCQNNWYYIRINIITFIIMVIFFGTTIHHWPKSFWLYALVLAGLFIPDRYIYWNFRRIIDIYDFIDTEPGDEVIINLTKKQLNIENQMTISFSEIAGITMEPNSIFKSLFIWSLTDLFGLNISLKCVTILYLKDKTQQLITINTLYSCLRFYRAMSKFVPVKIYK